MPGYGLDADPTTVAPAEFFQNVEALHGQAGDAKDLLSLIFDDWASAANGVKHEQALHAGSNGWHAGHKGQPVVQQQQQQAPVFQFHAQPLQGHMHLQAREQHEQQQLIQPWHTRQQLQHQGLSSSSAGEGQRTSGTGSGGAAAGSATGGSKAASSRGTSGAMRASKQEKPDNVAQEPGQPKVSRWKQSKAKMGTLEAQAAEAKEMANKMEDENLALRMRALAMEHTVAAREKQVSILSEHSARRRSSSVSGLSAGSAWSDTGSRGADNLMLGLGNGQCSSAACDLATVSVTALAAKLRRFIGQASVLLLQIADAQNTPAAQQATNVLAHMVDDFCTEMGTVFVLNTQTQFQILTCRIDQPDAGPSTPPPEHWDMVLKQLNVTPGQLLEVAACWDLNGKTMNKLQVEVESLRNNLAVAVQQGNTTAVSELQKGLSTALLNQALSCRAMAFILFGKILTPVQTTKAIVHSFPYFPNARELVSRLVAMREAMQK